MLLGLVSYMNDPCIVIAFMILKEFRWAADDDTCEDLKHLGHENPSQQNDFNRWLLDLRKITFFLGE